MSQSSEVPIAGVTTASHGGHFICPEANLQFKFYFTNWKSEWDYWLQQPYNHRGFEYLWYNHGPSLAASPYFWAGHARVSTSFPLFIAAPVIYNFIFSSQNLGFYWACSHWLSLQRSCDVTSHWAWLMLLSSTVHGAQIRCHKRYVMVLCMLCRLYSCTKGDR